jgi:hypothetical protein
MQECINDGDYVAESPINGMEVSTNIALKTPQMTNMAVAPLID